MIVTGNGISLVIIGFINYCLREGSDGVMKTWISKRSLVVILTLFVAALIGLAFLTSRISTLQILKLEGRDMEPALHRDDRIVITTDLKTLRRRDIVVFKYPADPSKRFVKRIVGLPGEMIEIRDGKVFVDGKLLEEEYVDPKLNLYPMNRTALRIPNQSYYVLGDNRDNSNDSRMWGLLSANFIEGTVLFHY